MTGNQLLPTLRAQIVALHDTGVSNRAIALRFNISRAAVADTLRLHQATGAFAYTKRSGRPRITSKVTDRAILRSCKTNPFAGSRAIQADLPANIDKLPSARTIRRRLVEGGFRSYKPAKKPRLSSKNIRDRLAFAKAYQYWTVDQWRSVMFSDETTICQQGTWIRTVRRPPGHRFRPQYTVPTVRSAPKVMIWGAIAARGRCGLWFCPKGTTITSPVYNGILRDKVQRFLQMRQCNYFQHDGAPCHQSRLNKAWLEANEINVLGPWPGNSPDLSPIENCWRIVKEKVAKHAPTSYDDLLDVIKRVWVQEISPELTDNLIASMPRRLAGVINAKGGHTKY